MAPPAVAIVIGVTAVVGITFAFHQLVYEPHLAPKLEVVIANWLDNRRRRRREASAYRAIPDEHDADLQDQTSDMVPPVEMGDMTNEVPGWRGATPLTINEAGGMAGGASDLRKRNTSNHATEEEPMWALKPELLAPTRDAPHNQYSLAQAPLSTATISHTSTPSTIESSLLNFDSPSTPSQNFLPRTLSPDSTASQRDPLADSILSNTVHETLFSAHGSRIQSPVRISPRGLQVNLTPMSDVDDEGHIHPLSQGRDPSATRSPRSPLASTIYESFTGTQAIRSPTLPPSAALSPRAQFVIHSPLSDSLSLVEHPTAPASTASWSDIGSAGAGGDRDELFFGSDAESWARAHNDRRT